MCSSALEKFALTACQAYNLGNEGNWFLSFRGGLYGARSRLRGATVHSSYLHDWHHGVTIHDREHHLAVLLFCLDSALECLVFALNALGWAADHGEFRDVTTAQGLTKVSPLDVLGSARHPRLSGYNRRYPSVVQLWETRRRSIEYLQLNHNVTKHREHGKMNGRARSDPPAHFLATYGPPDHHNYAVHAPMAEILLAKNPRRPAHERISDLNDYVLLETLEAEVRDLLEKSFCAAVADAHANIRLSEPELRAK